MILFVFIYEDFFLFIFLFPFLLILLKASRVHKHFLFWRERSILFIYTRMFVSPVLDFHILRYSLSLYIFLYFDLSPVYFFFSTS